MKPVASRSSARTVLLLAGMAAAPPVLPAPWWPETVARLEEAVAKSDAGALREVRGELLRALPQPPDGTAEALVRYALAYADNRLIRMPAVPEEEKAPLLEEAVEQLKRALVLQPRDAEIHALLATTYGAQISLAVGPEGLAETGMTLGPAASAATEQAAALDPSNPRVALVEGVSAFHRPVSFGGGLDKAEAALRRALMLFGQEAPGKAWPNWGRFDTHVWLGQVHARRGDEESAAREYREAEALAPASPWVKSLRRAIERKRAPLAGKGGSDPDRRLEASESLAAAMTRLGDVLREGDRERTATFFADSVRFRPPPAQAGATRAGEKWIRRHAWRMASGPAEAASRQQVVRAFEEFLGHFSEVEEVRFDLKDVAFESADAIRSQVAMAIVGRDQAGMREWARGLALIRAARVDGGWRLEEMAFETLESLLAATDLFSEVAAPAGVAVAAGRSGPARSHVPGEHGAAVGDIDGDGDVDLCVTADDGNHLYLNQGDGRFEDAAAEAGIRDTPSATAPLMVDIENDGDLDLFFSSMTGTQMLFENRLVPDGRLVFHDISLESGVSVATVGFSAVAGDVDGNGLPDIYVCGYNRLDKGQSPDKWYDAGNGTPNLLFLNQGRGTFREVARELGVDDRRWSYDAVFVDTDADGDQDLYVANDFGANALYRNQRAETGRLHFRDAGMELGASRPGFGMGVSFGDFDNDGDLDLHATYMSSPAADRIFSLFPPRSGPLPEEALRTMVAGNAVYENDGKGRFREVSAEIGPFRAGWAWGGGFVDFDNDGWADLHSSNGMLSGTDRGDELPLFIASMARLESAADGTTRNTRIFPDLASGRSFGGYERDTLFLNLGTRRYLDISGISGLDSITDGGGPVYADFDDDGDLDVFLPTFAAKTHLLFRNNVGQESRSLRVTLRGTRSGRDAFGAVVRVRTAEGTQTKVKAGGEGHLSQHDPRLLFGLGTGGRARWLEVTWPSGGVQRFTRVPAARSILVTEGRPTLETVAERVARLPDPLRDTDTLRALKLERGQPFPQIDLRALDGGEGQRLPTRGQATLLLLWATWSPGSVRALEEMDRWRTQLEKMGVRLVAASVDGQGGPALQSQAGKLALSSPSLHTTPAAVESLYRAYKLQVPALVLIDAGGGVVDVFGDASRRTRARIEHRARTRGGPGGR